MADITLTCPGCRAATNVPIEGDANEFTCGSCGERHSIHELDGFGEAAKDPLLGEVIADWEIKEKVGEGGFGCVYKAYDRNLQRHVALKVMLQSLTSNLEYVQKFIREAITAAQLNHPNIVGIHRVGRDEDRNLHFLVMEFLEGETLADRIDREGALPLDEAISFILQCADALAVAQEKNIIHRDIKPENIMIDKSGNVKITDFGLAKTLTTDMKSTKVMGTPHYMSPEQFEGKPVDGRTDIYSLGVTFYHMLTEAKPYAGTNTVQIIYSILTQEPKPVTELKPNIPVAIWNIIRKMIAKDVADRYANFRDVRKDLKAYLEGSLAETISCPSCSARNVRGRKFCSKCGTSLVAVCPKCGHEEAVGEQHCGDCGSDIAALLEIDRRLGEAARLREVGDLQSALKVYQEILEVDPDRADAETGASEIRADLDRIEERKSRIQDLLAGGDPDQALEALESLLETFPRNEAVKTYGVTVRKTLVLRAVDAHLLVADKAMEDGDHAAAIRSLETALEADESRADVRSRLEDLQRRLAAADDALTGARDALAAGRHAKALNLIREVLVFKPDHPEACAIREEAKKGVESIETFVREGREMLERRDYDTAVSLLETAVEISPEDEAVLALLETAKRRRIELRERIALVRKLIEGGSYGEAIVSVEKILAEREDDPAALALKLRAEELLASQERIQRCEFLLKQANEAEKRGDLETALAAVREVAELDPGHEKVPGVLAGLEEKIKEAARLDEQVESYVGNHAYEDAAATLVELLRLKPSDAKAAGRLAEIRGIIEQIDDGLLRARNELDQKRHDSAIEAAEQVLEIVPDSIEAQGIKQEAERGRSIIGRHLNEAENLIGSELFDDASEELTKALDLGATGGSVNELRRLAEDGKVQRLKSEATRSFDYKDYEDAQEKYNQILEVRGDDPEARRGLKIAEKAYRRSEREGVLSKAVVAAVLVLGLVFVQFRSIEASREEAARATGGDVKVIKASIDTVLEDVYAAEGAVGGLAAPAEADWRTVARTYAEMESKALQAGEGVLPRKFVDGREFAKEMAGCLAIDPENVTTRLAALRRIRESVQNHQDREAAKRRLSYVNPAIEEIESRIEAEYNSFIDQALLAENEGNWGEASGIYASLKPPEGNAARRCADGKRFSETMLATMEAGLSEKELLAKYQEARAQVGELPSVAERREKMLDQATKDTVRKWVEKVGEGEKKDQVDWRATADAYEEILGYPAVDEVGLRDHILDYQGFAEAMDAAAAFLSGGKFRHAYGAFGAAAGTAKDEDRKDRAGRAQAGAERDWIGAVRLKVGGAKDGTLTKEQFYEVIGELVEMAEVLGRTPKDLYGEVVR